MTKAIALTAPPAAWPELPIPQSVQIIAVDAEGKPTLDLASHYPGPSIATPDEAYSI